MCFYFSFGFLMTLWLYDYITSWMNILFNLHYNLHLTFIINYIVIFSSNYFAQNLSSSDLKLATQPFCLFAYSWNDFIFFIFGFSGLFCNVCILYTIYY